MGENWKDIAGYENRYSVSDKGRIWSKVSSKYMKPWKGKIGYLQIGLRHTGSPAKQFLIHRLVALAFIYNPEGKRTVNHKDGNKENNTLGNLEWMTHSENNKHAFSIGHRDSKGSKNARSKLTEEDVLWMRRMNGKIPHKEMAKRLGINSKYVSDVICGVFWKHI